jgi:hypothetical protein
MSGWSSDAKIHIFFILAPTNENKKALLVTMPQSKAPTNSLKPPTNSPEGERGQTPVQGYVLTVHDFCHERLRVGALAGISTNQASLLALAASKIQGSRGVGIVQTPKLPNSQ